MHQALSFCPLFKGIPSAEIIVLLSKIQTKIIGYPSENLIAQHNEVCDRLMIVLEGKVKAEMQDPSGKTIKIDDMGPGQPLAPAFLFGINNKFPVTVTSTSETKILNIYREELVKLLQLDIRVLNNYLFIICTRSQFLADKIKFLSFRTIKEKICLYLYEKSENEKYHTIEIKQSQQELADLFGVTRPSFARALSELEAEKLIKVEKKQFTILNLQALKKMIL